MDEKVKDVLMGETEKMEAAVTEDTTPLEAVADNVPADVVEETPEPKRKVRKGVVVGVAAAVVVIAIGVGVAVASQPASSGSDAGSSGSVAAASSGAAASKTSAASSSSASASASSAAASSASSAAAGGSSAGSASAIGGSAKDSQSAGATTGSQSQQGVAQGGGGATSSTNTSGSAGGNTSGGTTSDGAGAAASQPAHVHNWVPIVESRKVVDQEEQRVPTTRYSVGDGSVFDTLDAAEDYAESIAISGGPNYGVGSFVEYDVIPEQSHMEDIIVGYSCSDCGATK